MRRLDRAVGYSNWSWGKPRTICPCRKWPVPLILASPGLDVGAQVSGGLGYSYESGIHLPPISQLTRISM